MPNWCFNSIAIEGPKADVEKFLEAVKGNDKQPYFDFNGVVPMPSDYLGTQSPNPSEEFAEKLTEKYGSPDWYSWALANWGTKWNCTAIDEWDITYRKNNETYAQINVDTAWSPPTEFLVNASKIYPSLIFSNEFYEQGNCFIGSHVILKGYFESKSEPDWDSKAGIEMRQDFGIYNEEEDEKEND